MRAGAHRTRFGLTAVVALAAIAAFAVMGGTGLAGGLAKPAKDKKNGPGQYQYSAKKVTICHNEKVTLRVSVNALKAHVTRHGDTVGPCATTAAAKVEAVSAAAAKAAKAKKAKKKDGPSSDTTAGSGSASSGPGPGQGKANGKGKGNGKK